ncbi:MAG: hypothetical protein V1871_02500 [Planctomycetota bacterium]
MKSNKKMFYASIGLALISGLTFAMGCSSTKQKPVPPAVAPEVTQPVKEQPAPTPPEKVAVQVDTPNPTSALSSDAKGVLQQAVQNTFSAKSYAATMTMNTEIMGMNMSFTFDIKKCNDILYESGSILGMRFEMYSNMINKTVVIKDPRSQRWQNKPSGQENLIFEFEQIQRKLYMEHINDASFKEEVKIGENDCRIIEATVSAEDLQELIMSKKDLPMEFGNFALSKICLKLWVGKDDGRFYKTFASLEGSMEMPGGFPGENEDIEEEDPITPTNKSEVKEEASSENQMSKFKYEIETTYADYNKLEPIIIPPDAKNAMENLQDEKTPEEEDDIKEEEDQNHK